MDEGKPTGLHGRSSPGDPNFIKRPRGPLRQPPDPRRPPKMRATLLSSSMSMTNWARRLPAQHLGDVGGPEAAGATGCGCGITSLGEEQRAAVCARARSSAAARPPPSVGAHFASTSHSGRPQPVPSRGGTQHSHPSGPPPSIM